MNTEKINEKPSELDTIVSYAQITHYTLKNSGTKINYKTIKSEVKMFYDKFGNLQVNKLANLIFKEKDRE